MKNPRHKGSVNDRISKKGIARPLHLSGDEAARYDSHNGEALRRVMWWRCAVALIEGQIQIGGN